MNSREDIKPKNLKLHDFLVRKTAVKNMIDEALVEKIISHEMKSINAAFRTKDQVEISGFGKFNISQVKLAKKIKRVEEIMRRLLAKLEKSPGDEDILAKIDLSERELVYFRQRVKP